jgi:hypothetical protein
MKTLFFLLLLTNIFYFSIQYSNRTFQEKMLATSALEPQILLLNETIESKK